jgi:hypothetical protein
MIPPGPSIFLEVFEDTGSPGHGPGDCVGIITDAQRVGWSWYSRYPSPLYFTLPQHSESNDLLVPGLSHVKATFVDPLDGYSVVLWTGRVLEPDESANDVVWQNYSYLAELALSRTGYSVKYPSKLIGSQVVTPEWSRDESSGKFVNYGAKVQEHSLMNHIATGTIQNPLDTAGTGGMKTDPKFGVIDVPRLLLFFDLSEIGRANTDNNVTFEFTRTPPTTFNFWRDKGTDITARVLTYPYDIVDYRRVRGIAGIRNDLATIGTKGGSSTEIVQRIESGTYGSALFGRRQDTFTIRTLSGYPNLTKTEAQEDAQTKITKRAVKEAVRPARNMMLQLRTGKFRPFDGWDIEDTIIVDIRNGLTDIRERWRIVGVRGTLDAAGYRQSLFLAPPNA